MSKDNSLQEKLEIHAQKKDFRRQKIELEIKRSQYLDYLKELGFFTKKTSFKGEEFIIDSVISSHPTPERIENILSLGFLDSLEFDSKINYYIGTIKNKFEKNQERDKIQKILEYEFTNSNVNSSSLEDIIEAKKFIKSFYNKLFEFETKHSNTDSDFLKEIYFYDFVLKNDLLRFNWDKLSESLSLLEKNMLPSASTSVVNLVIESVTIPSSIKSFQDFLSTGLYDANQLIDINNLVYPYISNKMIITGSPKSLLDGATLDFENTVRNSLSKLNPAASVVKSGRLVFEDWESLPAPGDILEIIGPTGSIYYKIKQVESEPLGLYIEPKKIKDLALPESIKIEIIDLFEAFEHETISLEDCNKLFYAQNKNHLLEILHGPLYTAFKRDLLILDCNTPTDLILTQDSLFNFIDDRSVNRIKYSSNINLSNSEFTFGDTLVITDKKSEVNFRSVIKEYTPESRSLVLEKTIPFLLKGDMETMIYDTSEQGIVLLPGEKIKIPVAESNDIQKDNPYGTSWKVNNGIIDFNTVLTGKDLFLQNLDHRLATEIGTYRLYPDYGSSITEIIRDGDTLESYKMMLGNAVKAVCDQDPLVESAVCGQDDISLKENRIEINFSIILKNGEELNRNLSKEVETSN